MENKYIFWTEIKGAHYPLCLNVGSAAAIEKEFGSVPEAVRCIGEHVANDEYSSLFTDSLRVAVPLAESGKAYVMTSATMTGTTAEEIPDFPSAETLAVALSGNEIMRLWNDCYEAMRMGQTREVEVAKDNDPKNAENAM